MQELKESLGKCKVKGIQITGTGVGHSSLTHDLQNKPENIFFRPELRELWAIL